jgi:cobalamin synthase
VRAALSFLTVLPVGGDHAAPGRRALLAFPLAGLALGAGWAVAGWIGAALWTPLVGAALVVAVDLAATGGLHADAVADVADGLASRRRGAEALAVMRDPRVGAVGASAAVAVVLLRFAWVAALLGAGMWLALVAVPACGRAAMVLLLARGRRPERPSLAAALPERPSPAAARPVRPSLAAALARAATPGVAAVAGLIAATAAVAAGTGAAALARAPLAAGALAGAGAVAVACAVALAGEAWWRRAYGALTGDAAGSVGAVAELGALGTLGLLVLDS